MTETNSDLNGITVVVTRPKHQAQALCEKIERLGGRVIRYPVLAIESPADLSAVVNLIARLDEFNIAIFISANAVDRAMHLIESGRLPENIKVAAVGRASAKALQRYGQRVDILPQGKFNSEALLIHPELNDVAGKKIVIFRGEGGRELLAETLSKRGAIVEYAECYQRSRPADPDNSQLMQLWARGEVDVITVTSNEALKNLYDMVGKVGRHWLQCTPIIGVSERIIELAKHLGIKQAPIITKIVSDDAIVDAIVHWKAAHTTLH